MNYNKITENKPAKTNACVFFDHMKIARADGDYKDEGAPIGIYRMAQHLLREIGERDYIDNERSYLNEVLIGEKSPEAVYKQAVDAFLDCGYGNPLAGDNLKKLRKGAWHGVSVLFSLPADTNINTRIYFRDCLEWCKHAYDGEILLAIAHHDEAAPHLHIILLPLINGYARGSKIAGAKTSPKHIWRKANFHQTVGKKYGLQPLVKPRLDCRTLKKLIAKLHAEGSGKLERFEAAVMGYLANPV